MYLSGVHKHKNILNNLIWFINSLKIHVLCPHRIPGIITSNEDRKAMTCSETQHRVYMGLVRENSTVLQTLSYR